MATYKIDRASSLQTTGKFKFDYQVVIAGGDLNAGTTNLYNNVSAGAFPSFILKSVTCSLYVGEIPPITKGGNSTPGGHPWEDRGGFFGFGNFLDPRDSTVKIPITFSYQSPGELIANGVRYKGGFSETIIFYTEPYDRVNKPDKILSGLLTLS